MPESPPGPTPTTLSLGVDSAAARTARTAVAKACESMSTSTREAAILLASELVTNAVRHARPPISITIERDEQVVKVTVADAHAARPVLQPRRAFNHRTDPAAEAHRGLQIVDALAAAWGVRDLEPEGKAVWFYLSDDQPPVF